MCTYSNRLQPALQKAITTCCSVLPPEIVMHDDAYIGGRSENNIKCVVHDDLGWKNQTTRYILPRHWLYKWFSQFHVVELIQLFHGTLQLFQVVKPNFSMDIWCELKQDGICDVHVVMKCSRERYNIKYCSKVIIGRTFCLIPNLKLNFII